MAKQIGTVRGDFQIQQRVRFDDLIDRFTDRQIGIQNPQAAGVFANAKFLAAAHHAIGVDSTKLAFFNLKTARKRCPRKR